MLKQEPLPARSGESPLVTANYADDAGGVLLGNGDGTFQEVRTFSAGRRPFAVAVGDFDRDGFPDLAVPNFVSDKIAILLNARDWSQHAPGAPGEGSKPSQGVRNGGRDACPGLALFPAERAQRLRWLPETAAVDQAFTDRYRQKGIRALTRRNAPHALVQEDLDQRFGVQG